MFRFKEEHVTCTFSASAQEVEKMLNNLETNPYTPPPPPKKKRKNWSGPGDNVGTLLWNLHKQSLSHRSPSRRFPSVHEPHGEGRVVSCPSMTPIPLSPSGLSSLALVLWSMDWPP